MMLNIPAFSTTTLHRKGMDTLTCFTYGLNRNILIHAVFQEKKQKFNNHLIRYHVFLPRSPQGMDRCSQAAFFTTAMFGLNWFNVPFSPVYKTLL
jgi:hypothetical protein